MISSALQPAVGELRSLSQRNGDYRHRCTGLSSVIDRLGVAPSVWGRSMKSEREENRLSSFLLPPPRKGNQGGMGKPMLSLAADKERELVAAYCEQRHRKAILRHWARGIGFSSLPGIGGTLRPWRRTSRGFRFLGIADSLHASLVSVPPWAG
jgi:hypothetical protein